MWGAYICEAGLVDLESIEWRTVLSLVWIEARWLFDPIIVVSVTVLFIYRPWAVEPVSRTFRPITCSWLNWCYYCCIKWSKAISCWWLIRRIPIWLRGGEWRAFGILCDTFCLLLILRTLMLLCISWLDDWGRIFFLPWLVEVRSETFSVLECFWLCIYFLSYEVSLVLQTSFLLPLMPLWLRPFSIDPFRLFLSWKPRVILMLVTGPVFSRLLFLLPPFLLNLKPLSPWPYSVDLVPWLLNEPLVFSMRPFIAKTLYCFDPERACFDPLASPPWLLRVTSSRVLPVIHLYILFKRKKANKCESSLSVCNLQRSKKFLFILLCLNNFRDGRDVLRLLKDVPHEDV